MSLEHSCLAQRATGDLPRLCDNLPFSRPDRGQSLPASPHRGFKVVLTNRGLACQISLPPVPSCPSHSLLTLNPPSPAGAPLLPPPGPCKPTLRRPSFSQKPVEAAAREGLGGPVEGPLAAFQTGVSAFRVSEKPRRPRPRPGHSSRQGQLRGRQDPLTPPPAAGPGEEPLRGLRPRGLSSSLRGRGLPSQLQLWETTHRSLQVQEAWGKGRGLTIS